jgi:hypothetical protein
MVVSNITLNLISGPRLDIFLGFSMRFANRRGTIHRGRHLIRCILKDGNLKDFLQPQECTEYSNLVQPNYKLPMIELTGAHLPTVTERLITPVSKTHFKPQRTQLSTREDLELMHKRFSNANIESIVKGLKDQTIKGYDVSI